MMDVALRVGLVVADSDFDFVVGKHGLAGGVGRWIRLVAARMAILAFCGELQNSAEAL
jgi:hypothetical protein